MAVLRWEGRASAALGKKAKRQLHFNGNVKLPSLMCTTTPCPTAGWPPVTWKGSGIRVSCRSPSQAARALARNLLPDYDHKSIE
ncbi:unnamed protein product [Spirodela intermedia]|uniref:Uncharacterized protein n=1 Tax=Spirodela intermedia TaxID=51605 RepID=A0ABN7ED36_SPIIN|nr:unnamed protein product [Spirodela intermedia]